MAQKRLKLAGEYLDKNLYTAFYEELHKALIGFVSDKLNMDMSEISKDNIASALTEGGVSEEQTKAFTDLLDACEFARYSPDSATTPTGRFRSRSRLRKRSAAPSTNCRSR